MTMHLVHPSLSTTGKKKGKQKFRNAEQARVARQNAESWENLKKKHGVTEDKKKITKKVNRVSILSAAPAYRGSDQPRIPSKADSWDPCLKSPDKKYTGSAIVGISTLHKSNAVPVFSKEDAIDISKMRRG